MIRAKAQQEAYKNQQDHVLGPGTFTRLAGHRVLLGHSGKLRADLTIASQNKSQGNTEANNTTEQKHIRGLGRFVQAGVLHARLLTQPLSHGAREEEWRYLQEYNHPNQDTDASSNLYASQLQAPVWMHHGKIAVNADAGHECDPGIGVREKDDRGQSTQKVSEGPVEATDVVGDPAR